MSSCEKCIRLREAKVSNSCRPCREKAKFAKHKEEILAKIENEKIYNQMREEKRLRKIQEEQEQMRSLKIRLEEAERIRAEQERIRAEQEHRENLETLVKLKADVEKDGTRISKYINPSFCPNPDCRDRTCNWYRGKHSRMTPYLDEDICLKAVSAPTGHPVMIRYVPESFKTYEVCMTVLTNPKISDLFQTDLETIVSFLPHDKPYSEEFFLKSCSILFRAPMYFPKKMRTFEMYNKAIKINPECFEYTPLQNKELTSRLIIQNGLDTELRYY